MIRELADAAVAYRDALVNGASVATIEAASKVLIDAVAEYEADEGEKAEARETSRFYGGDSPQTLHEQQLEAIKLK